jgi:aminotransferase
MRDRTITISGASKTFSVTGWRVGWIIAPPDVTDAIRKVHDFLTVGSPAPLQEAVGVALEQCDADFYRTLAGQYRNRREILCQALSAAGFKITPPEGAYYVLADFTGVSDLPDVEFSYWLTKDIGVTPVPGSSFYSEKAMGRNFVRFAFCKTDELLREAGMKIMQVRSRA